MGVGCGGGVVKEEEGDVGVLEVEEGMGVGVGKGVGEGEGEGLGEGWGRGRGGVHWDGFGWGILFIEKNWWVGERVFSEFGRGW